MPTFVCIKAKHIKKVLNSIQGSSKEDAEWIKQLPYVLADRTTLPDGTVRLVLDAILMLPQDPAGMGTTQAMTLTVHPSLADDLLYEVDFHQARFLLMKKGCLV